MSIRIGIDSIIQNNLFENLLSTIQQNNLISSLFKDKKCNFQLTQRELENNIVFKDLEEIKKKKLLNSLFVEPENKLINNEEWMTLQKAGDLEFKLNKNKFINKTLLKYRPFIGKNLNEVENNLILQNESYKIENAFYFGKDGNNIPLSRPLDYHANIFVFVDRQERVVSIEKNPRFSNIWKNVNIQRENEPIIFSSENLFYGC